MNFIKLAQDNVKNQHQKPSWIDDPFNLGIVTGVSKVSDNQNNLNNYIQELVASYGEYTSDNCEIHLDMLTEEEQDELLRLYIESIDREIEYACYGDDDSINNDFLCAMLKMLQCNNDESRENFALITRKNLLSYYKNTLENLLDEGCNIYFNNEMNELGYSCKQDLEHGDFHWRKY